MERGLEITFTTDETDAWEIVEALGNIVGNEFAGEMKLDWRIFHVSIGRDKNARVNIPEEWISRDSLRVRLKTIIGISAVPVSVARPEAVWALKLQAGRDQDLLDLYAIFDTPFEMGAVISLFRSFNSETLKEKLSLTSEKVDSKKLFEDAVSRMGTKRTEKTMEKWQKFATKVGSVIEESLNV